MADRKSNGELIQYQTEDGETVIRLQARDGNVWLSQADMAELFQATKQNISLHIRNILEDGEQDERKCEDCHRHRLTIDGQPADSDVESDQQDELAEYIVVESPQ